MTDLAEAEVEQLVKAAENAQEEYAYPPYSEFPVGAAIRVDETAIYQAGNVELKPTVASMHAEQLAVGKVLEMGYMGAEAIAIALNADQPPCGMCLQCLASLEPDLEMEVFVKNTKEDSEPEEHHLSELLPEAYTPDVRHDV